MEAATVLPTMDDATTLTTAEVATLVGQAIDRITKILEGDFTIGTGTLSHEQTQAQIAACHLVFNEFLQAPQVVLPHPGALFAGPVDEDEPAPTS